MGLSIAVPDGRKERHLFAQRRFPWFLVALVGVTVVASVPGLARAGVILAVSTAL